MNLNDEVRSRLFRRTIKTPSGCWIWVGALISSGYGSIGIDNRTELTHRVSYLLAGGEIPEGYHIDHLCRVRRCLNPLHLQPVPPRINALRGQSPNMLRHKSGRCVNGHALPQETVQGNGSSAGRRRPCRDCKRERAALQAADPEWRKKRAAYERERRRKAEPDDGLFPAPDQPQEGAHL